MLVQDFRDRFFRRRWRDVLRQHRPAVWRALCLLCYSLAIFAAGVSYHITAAPDPASSFPPGTLPPPVSDKYDPTLSQPPRLDIGISQADYVKLLTKRNEALRTGILLSGNDDYVPAKIRQGDTTVEAKVRLKGDWLEHLDGKKWSFRISVKGGDTLLGMKELSIQHPKTRNYIYEWIFHRILREEDVIALRFEFVDVTLNETPLGIYALEEHFDKRLIENNRRREGPILKFDEDILWANRARNSDDLSPETAFYSSPVEVFQEKRTIDTEHLRDLYQHAFNLLERFRSGKLPASDVFDVERMARYYALADLLGGQHGMFYHNLRFYMNPVTMRLEPIAFDVDAGVPITGLLGSRAANMDNAYYDFDRLLFSDRKILEAYLKELSRVSDSQYLPDMMRRIDGDLAKSLNLMYRDYSDVVPDYAVFENNARLIRQALSPVRGALAYFDRREDSGAVLRVGNLQALPLEILGAGRDGAILFRPEVPVTLAGKVLKRALEFSAVTLRPAAGMNWPQDVSGLQLVVRIPGTRHQQSVPIAEWPRYDEQFRQNDVMLQPAPLPDFPFLDVDDAAGVVAFRPGDWTLDRNLVIPVGYVVTAPAGFSLDVVNGAAMVSYSPLQWIGTEENPIRIVSKDATGQGVAVVGAKEKSVIKYVRFENLSAPQHQGWALTGAVTFYESPVDILNCRFLLNHDSDDSLNIVRSDFLIQDSHFSQIERDAIDIDFSNGNINDVTVVKAGNDAVDLSGSRVNINGVHISEALDKGISAGEDSQVILRGADIHAARIAAASKDLSFLFIEGANLLNCKIGLSAYQKKPEFGPGRIEARHVQRTNVETPVAADEGSVVILNGQSFSGTGGL